eukprot:1719040-Pleurochrysis_carterae.AAC.1
MSLIEEYYRQGVGYIEVKGVPMIYYLTLSHGDRVEFDTSPSDRPFTITVGIRVWREAKRPGGE